jgi:1-deoxyxylulose-5-phosphate synthase
LKTLATEIGEPLSKLAIAWVLANRSITSAILGASRPDQLTDTLGAVDLEVPAELKTKLDEVTDQYRLGERRGPHR